LEHTSWRDQWVQQAQVDDGRDKDYGKLSDVDSHKVADSVDTRGCFPAKIHGIFYIHFMPGIRRYSPIVLHDQNESQEKELQLQQKIEISLQIKNIFVYLEERDKMIHC